MEHVVDVVLNIDLVQKNHREKRFVIYLGEGLMSLSILTNEEEFFECRIHL